MAIQSHSCVTPALGAPVYLEQLSASALVFSPETATAAVRLTSDGDADSQLNLGSWVNQFAWLLVGAGADFECRVSMTSGTSFSGSALDTWLGLGSTRSWSLDRSSTGITEGFATLELRRAGTSFILASDTITLSATVEL